MKNMKKLFAALLTIIMVLGLTTTAFAAQADLTGHTFKAYQIFTADSITANGELGNLAWGNGISEAGQTAILDKYVTTGDKTVENLVKVIGAMQDDSTAAKEFAQFVYQYITGDGTEVTSGTTKLPIGYYLIKDTTATNVDVYNLSVLKVSDNATAVTITNKTDVPSSDKKIVEGDKKVTTNEASIGDVVNYEITGTMPSNLAEYETYYVCFNDTLSKGLTYNGDAKVYIGEKEVTKYFYRNATDYDATAGTKITVAIEDILSLNNVDGVTITANTVITIKYSATLNENAVIAGEGNPNDVNMDYSNNPDQSGTGTPGTTPPPENPDKPQPQYPTGTTPEKEVKTYVTELTILKTDENGDILTGAEFQLTGDGVNKIVIKTAESFVEDADGTYYKLADGKFTTTAPTVADDETDNTSAYDSTTTKYKKTVTTSVVQTGTDVTAKAFVNEKDGKVTFTGLGVGSYTITETITPTGYNTVAPVTFTVTFDAEKGKFAAEGVTLEADNTLSTTIVNKKGSTLPETGGIGTTIFYVAGAILALGAGVVLVAKRRMAR